MNSTINCSLVFICDINACSSENILHVSKIARQINTLLGGGFEVYNPSVSSFLLEDSSESLILDLCLLMRAFIKTGAS